MLPEMQLRSYQREAIDAVLAGWSAGRHRQCLALPTGAGKTETSIGLLLRARADGIGPLAFVVERLSLLDQARERLTAAGLCCALVQGDRTADAASIASADVLVCSAQTLLSRDLWPEDLGILAAVVDEAHYNRSAVRRWLDAGIPILGLTATPLAEWMPEAWDDLLSPCTTTECIDAGWLSAPLFRVDAPDPTTAVDPITGRRFGRAGPDWSAGEAEAIMSPHIKVTAGLWRQLCDRAEADGGFGGHRPPTIVQAATVHHAALLRDAFRAVDPDGTWQAVTQDVDAAETDAAIGALRSGRTRGLVAVHKLGVGVDVPDATVLVSARPSRSLITWAQWVGRIMRRPESGRGRRPVVLDCAGNAHRHARALHQFWSRGATWPLTTSQPSSADSNGAGGHAGPGTKVCPDHPTILQSLGAPVCAVCGRPLADAEPPAAEDARQFAVHRVRPDELARTLLLEAQRRVPRDGVDRARTWARRQVEVLASRPPRPGWPTPGWDRRAHGAPDPVVRRTLRRNARRWKQWREDDSPDRPAEPPAPDTLTMTEEVEG